MSVTASAAKVQPRTTRLRVQTRGLAADVVVTALPNLTIHELVRELASELAVDVPAEVSVAGRRLPMGVTLADSGLVHGDTLSFGAAIRDGLDTASGYDVVVVGGPSAGKRLPVPGGSAAIGRESGAEIVIEGDAGLSNRHVAVSVAAGGVTVTDLRSTNGTTVDGVALEPNVPRAISEDEIVRAGRTYFSVRRRHTITPAHMPPTGAALHFNRPPRVRTAWTPPAFEVDAAPESPRRARLPIAASLLPIALAVPMTLITHAKTMLLVALLSPLMAIGSFVEDRRGGKRGYRDACEDYRRRLRDLADELAAARASELAERGAAAPTLDEVLERVQERRSTVWERRPTDADYLQLRVGIAAQPSAITVRIADRGNEDLRAEAERMTEWFGDLPVAPVVARLTELGSIGIAGEPPRVDGIARSVVAQLAALHSPLNVSIAAALPSDGGREWDWLKWLPHADPSTSPLQPAVALGQLASRELLESLTAILDERRQQSTSQGSVSLFRDRSIVLLLDERTSPDRGLVAPLLIEGPTLGIHVLWLGSQVEQLPGDCGAIVELAPEVAKARFAVAKSGVTIEDVTPDLLAADLVGPFAQSLAPLRDVTAAAAGQIPEKITLGAVMGVDDFSPELTQSLWAASKGLIAPIGASANGPFVVDIRGNGPHGLMSGTTGSGKSELLQTLVVSLATHVSPQRLNFILVDFKGESGFKDCIALPHVVGFASNLNEQATRRALISFYAELRRRELLFKAADVKDLIEMERLRPDEAPPALLIVIDEFAKAVEVFPEFMPGVLDIAQRGRSLGVHVLLAAQTPGNVVSESAKENMNLRIALRANNADASTAVLGVADAVKISKSRPGRAFARLGHGDLIEFQSAFIGATHRVASAAKPVEVTPFTLAPPARVAQRRGDDDGSEKDLTLLVRNARAASAALGLPPAQQAWLPALGDVIPLLDVAPSGRPGVAAVGILDEPEVQQQRPFEVDLVRDGNVFVYGVGGSGKSTFLRTLAVSLARDATADDLHIYALDFASRQLKTLDELPHCGGVVFDDDDERVSRLFQMLRLMAEERKELLARAGAVDIDDYLRSGGTLPRVLVLLDGYPAFRAAYEKVNLGELVELLPRLLADGRSIGMHFALSADRRGGVPNAIASAVPSKVVLRLADEDEYTSVGIDRKKVKGMTFPPGRGFAGDGTEVQIAVLSDDLSGEGQLAAIREEASRARQRSDAQAPKVEPLAADVDRRTLPAAADPWRPVLGISDATGGPVAVDLTDGNFLVVGPLRSGRSTTLATLAESLRSAGVRDLRLLAPRRNSPLAALDIWTSVVTGVDECVDAAVGLAEIADASEPVVVVIDDLDELNDGGAAMTLETLVKRGRDGSTRVVAAAERQAAVRAYSGPLREIRKDQNGILLVPDADTDGDILGVKIPRRSNPVYPPGRGYRVHRGGLELVQVAH